MGILSIGARPGSDGMAESLVGVNGLARGPSVLRWMTQAINSEMLPIDANTSVPLE